MLNKKKGDFKMIKIIICIIIGVIIVLAIINKKQVKAIFNKIITFIKNLINKIKEKIKKK